MSSTEALQPDRDAVLYLLDASVQMHADAMLQKALDAIINSIRLIHKRDDRHFNSGVIFYNCKAPVVDAQFDGSMMGMRVSDPRLESLRLLNSINVSLISGNQRDPAPNGQSPIVSALQRAKLELAQLGDLTFKRLVIITNDSEPWPIRELQRLFHDLVSMNVLIVPIFIQGNHGKFNPLGVWSKFVYMPPSMSTASRNSNVSVSLYPYQIHELETGFEQLVLSKAERKTVSFRGVLTTASLVIGVAAYKVVNKATPRRSEPVFRSATGLPQHLGRTRTFVESESREPVRANRQQSAFVLASKQPLVVPESLIAKLQELCDPSQVRVPRISITRFLKASDTKVLQMTALTINNALLIIPSNFDVENSKSAFYALHRSMTRKQLVAVATLWHASTSKPPIQGILMACDGSAAAAQMSPSTKNGMFFKEVSYLDDFRDYPNATSNVSSEPVIKDSVTDLLHKFYLEDGFNPYMFSHPSITQFNTVLDSIALHRRPPGNEAFDPTKPSYDKIEKYASTEINLLAALLNKLGEGDMKL